MLSPMDEERIAPTAASLSAVASSSSSSSSSRKRSNSVVVVVNGHSMSTRDMMDISTPLQQPGEQEEASALASSLSILEAPLSMSQQSCCMMRQDSEPESHSQEESSSQLLISTQIESLTQMDCTQQSQQQFDELLTLSSSPPPPLSPPAPLPWGRLVPCAPSKDNPPINLVHKGSGDEDVDDSYWLGRSSSKCDIPVLPGTSLSKRETAMMEWAHSMISNQHCRITYLSSPTPAATSSSSSSSLSTDADSNNNNNKEGSGADEAAGGGGSSSNSSRSYDQVQQTTSATATATTPQIVLEDHSGNGTFVNQSVHLSKGHQRMLHSGDEICLVNADTLRKRIPSSRLLQTVLQQYTYVLVLTNKPKRGPCVNPRAMNYMMGSSAQPNDLNGSNTASGASSLGLERGLASPRSARRIEAHYEIREILGDGTSGQVRRAIHRQTGQQYAVKVISLRRQLDLTSMEHEVHMMQSLDHPYIVQLVDVFVHHGIAMYLVMELVSGGDLFDRIVQHERYPEVDARRVMRRLLSAVHYLHQSKNIVHRDLKPENILCGSNPTHVKLADFGLAKTIQSDGLKTFCGTPQYFAPEVLQRRTTVAGSGRYGKPADMWSLGVILYILLTGRPPFEAHLDPLQAYDALDFDDPVWKGMPQAQELVQQMLRLDPKRRITVRQACGHPWINTEDGDTHVHPLDDPAVTGRKRLFLEPASSNNNYQENEEDREEEHSTAPDTDSIVSKTDSLMSKEDFAAAATSSHQRVESVDFLDLKSAMLAEAAEANSNNPATAAGSEQEHDDTGTAGDDDDDDDDDDSSDTSVDAASGTSSKMECSTNHSPEKQNRQHHQGDSMDATINAEERFDHTGADPDPSSPTKSEPTSLSASPDMPTIGLLIARELSVTPSECGDDDLPRSPLAAMNLNERSNRFRSQVLRQQHQHEEGGEESSPSSPMSRRGGDASQVAVTPTASNVRPSHPPSDKDLSCCEDDGETEEDPILSQFSSGPSSLESFPDSPVKLEAPTPSKSSLSLMSSKDTGSSKSKKKKKKKNTNKDTKTTDKKRKRSKVHDDDDEVHGNMANGSSSALSDNANPNPTKQVRQTKLSAWFVPKKAKQQCESK